MQALHDSGQMSPVINQISHKVGGFVNSYQNSGTHGFSTGASGGHTRIVNNNSFNSQQPTQSSKAKQVKLQHRKMREQQQSQSIQIHAGAEER